MIVGDEGAPGNLAFHAVSSFEDDLMQNGCPVGKPLGSLKQVQQSLGLGRPVLHETIGILEARGLIETRRGPGGGVFTAAPSTGEVVRALLMHLAIGHTPAEAISEFRLLTWRAIAEACLPPVRPLARDAGSEGPGFAVEIALASGKPTLALIADLAERLVRACEGEAAPQIDDELFSAFEAGDAECVSSRLEQLAKARAPLRSPVDALATLEGDLGRKMGRSAMILASRLVEEMAKQEAPVESEWETAERLGFTEQAVRQARRILQDFGVMDCRQGRRGGAWAVPAGPGGVVRLLAPCLLANGITPLDNVEAASLFTRFASELAATKMPSRRKAARLAAELSSKPGEADDFFQQENELLALARNPLVEIVVRSLGFANMFNMDVTMDWVGHVDIAAFNRRILLAIARGDRAAAGRLAQAKNDAMDLAVALNDAA